MKRAILALAVASMAVLGACTSQPSARTLVIDTIESIDGLSDAERTCMREVVEAMSKAEVEELSKQNVGAAISGPDSGDADMQAFIADLADCRSPS